MFEIREFMPFDAEKVLSWISDEKSFRQWSADKYDSYPPKPEEMNDFYASVKSLGGRAFMFCDDGKEIGHFILRPLTDESIKTVRIGFIIVDSSIRGKGYGRKMLEIAVPFALSEYEALRITLGVFENNPKAKKCYESVGFRQWSETSCAINGELWKCLEMEYTLIKSTPVE